MNNLISDIIATLLLYAIVFGGCILLIRGRKKKKLIDNRESHNGK